MAGGRRLVALVGPTTSGKTGVAVRLAAESSRPLEVVSLDSRQLYRHLDLGTGKPTAEEQAAVRHHLIDVIDPDETFDAARFREAVTECVRELWGRGVTPVLVGGAGFYLRALTEGFFQLPADAESLATVRAQLDDLPLEELRGELQRVDPAGAERIHPNDRYRTGRALEIFRLTGRAMSDWEQEFVPDPALGCEFDVFHLSPPRDVLHERIRARAEHWFGTGWVEEVQQLRPDWGHDAPGLNILGYREIQQYLDRERTAEQAVEAIVVGTRQYARQQEVWFRKLHARWRGTLDDPALIPELLDAVAAAAP